MPFERAAFVTIGQSPRDDILSEMRPWWSVVGSSLTVVQVGALDGIGPGELGPSTPSAGEELLVSRLRDGKEVLLGARWVEERVRGIVSALESEPLDFVVLLCTGHFPELRSNRPLVQAQNVVDHGIAALAGAVTRVGVLLPHERQTRSFRCEVAADRTFFTSYASPYSGGRFAEAAGELVDAGVDIVVMHCMGYSESDRREVAERTGKPVLLARRMVAVAVAQLL